MTDTRLARGELERFGAFFAVSTHDTPPAAPWQPLGDLVSDVTVLRRRVHAVRDALARGADLRIEDVEHRVAASTAHLGLVARLLAPAVAVAALGPYRLDLALRGLWWQDRLGTPFPLSVPAALTTAVPTTAVPTAAVPTAAVLSSTGALAALTDAVGREFTVSAQVLWGNIGSAANSAASLVAVARSALASRAYAVADELLVDHRIDGGGLHAGPGFRRRSCCLIYRVGGDASAACGDCVLRAGPRRGGG